jgi:hypothetical protein
MARITNNNSWSGNFSEATETFVADTFGVVLKSFSGDWASLVTEEIVGKILVRFETMAEQVKNAEENADYWKKNVASVRENARQKEDRTNENFTSVGKLIGDALKQEAISREYCGEFEQSVGKIETLLKNNGYYLTGEAMMAAADRRKKFKVEVEVLAHDNWSASDAINNLAYSGENPLVTGTARVLPTDDNNESDY